MDICETEKAFQKHSTVENPRPPLVPAEKNNGTTHRSRTREISSRYRSPIPSTSSGTRRCPSPNITRTGAASSVSVPNRAISAERKRPSTPPSPSTPAHDTSANALLASRKIAGGRLPEVLWPSTMRSLSVSFQSDVFSLPISKREKPVTHVPSDRTLKPSSNIAHRQANTPPASRPERKRSPLKGKNATDHSENSKPVDGVHARSVDQHRWPSRTNLKPSSNSLNRSMDLIDKTSRTSAVFHQTMGTPALRRMSMPGELNKPLQKTASDALRLLSSLGDVGTEFAACPIDDNSTRISKHVSSSSLERAALITPAVRSQSLSAPGSRASSPIKTSASLSSKSRGVSPSRTKVFNPAPSRGASPSRIRPSSPARQSISSTSVLSFISDMKKGNKVANHIEDVHQLRLLYNRHLQWRYVNARADVVMQSKKLTAEKLLYNVWGITSDIWNSITEKRIELQQFQLMLKLYAVLNDQMAYLDEWALIEKDHNRSLSQTIEDLEASTLRLPVTGGATAGIKTLKRAVCSAVDVMQAMGSSISSFLSKVEGMNCVISELADVAAQERAMLDECEALLASTASMQVEEYSRRTHLIQSRQAWKSSIMPGFDN